MRATGGSATGWGRGVATVAMVAVIAMVACTWAAPARAGMSLGKLSFVDASYGWATAYVWSGDFNEASSMAVVKTTDGGATWAVQKSTLAFNGTGVDVQFANRSTGIWVNSFVYRTKDGGAHWRRVALPKKWGGASFVDFTTRSVVWLAGQYGSDPNGRCVARSANGGRTWVSQLMQSHVFPAGVTGLSAPTTSTAYMWSLGLWATHNGGGTWARVRSDYGFKRNAMWQIAFPARSTGWAMRHYTSVLVKTTDGGRHWKKQFKGIATRLYGLDFINAKTGWLVGAAGVAFRTRNGGRTWTAHQLPTTGNLVSVDFIDKSHGWVVGAADYGEDSPLFRTSDGGETWQQVR
jgi:photosystem II stability/assembly factor-like uncharacterized protein